MQNTSSPTFRVLLADDDRDHCRIVERVLANEGFLVEVTHDGVSTLEAVGEFQPMVVILDSLLPQKSGLECLAAIRANPECCDVRVVMCSGRTGIDYVLECTEAGAQGFFHKPVDAESLPHRLHKIMGTR